MTDETDNCIEQPQNHSDIHTFLQVMLHRPDPGIDFHDHYLEVRLVGQNTKIHKRHFFAASDSDLEAKLAAIVSEAFASRSHVYVGLALRDSDKSGKDSDCSLLTLLVVDHDEWDGVKIKDISDEEAREAARRNILAQLQSETDFPPTLIVDSGNGFHAYYALDGAINVREQGAAIRRKGLWLAERYGQCPGDTAMLKLSQPIRLPGSHNVKQAGKPRLCCVVDYQPERRYNFAELPEAVSQQEAARRPLALVNPSEVKSFTYPFWESVFLRWMVEHPAEQTYPLWLGAASTLAYFGEEGREAFHELSRNYPAYSEAETNDLFNGMLVSRKNGIGPVTYAKLAKEGFSQKDDTSAASPAIYIKKLWQKRTFAAMGVGYGEDGSMTFNPNVFCDYLLERQQLLIHEGVLFYEYQGGVWQPLPEYRLLRLIRNLIEGVKKNSYQMKFGLGGASMLKLAAPEAKEMNIARHLVNLKNGMLDTTTFALLPHDPQYLSTVQIGITYDPGVQCPRFEQFLDEVMEGDAERKLVLQEMTGYLLTAETTIATAFFLYGAGANGKSLFLDILTLLIGRGNVSNLSLQDLEDSFKRYALVNKNVNIATENEISSKGFNSQYFKAIVSGDAIQVEKKYQDSFSYTPTAKLVFAVNNLPYSPDRSHGLYRRILILPFNRRFDGRQADKHLKQKLQAELPGILNWALAGLKRLREQDYEFSSSEVIEKAVSGYKQDQNPMLNYMAEMLELAEITEQVAKARIKEQYQVWCRRNGLDEVVRMSPQRFWNIFKANCRELGLPYEVKVSNGVRYLKGVSLRDTDRQELRSELGILEQQESWIA